MTSARTLTAVALSLTAATPAAAQCVGRPDFDACMAGILGRAQAQNNAAMTQTWQNYLRVYGPWLRQQYARLHPPMSFEQFAYYNMMTANGTNIQGGLDAQRRQFEGNQRAYATVQQGNSDYRAGMYANSQAYSNMANSYSQQAIRGNSAQVNPYTGQTQWLPYSNQPYNQPFSQGGNSYVSTPQGYYMWNGSGWSPMTPR